MVAAEMLNVSAQKGVADGLFDETDQIGQIATGSGPEPLCEERNGRDDRRNQRPSPQLFEHLLLNGQAVPWFEERGVRALRVLTDRGTEYCRKIERHEYQLYLALEDIDHTKTKAKSPQTHGICKRLHRTMQEGFYPTAFRKRIYSSIEMLQADVPNLLEEYNRSRPHSGRYCYGKTPFQTFEKSKHLAKAKMLDEYHLADSTVREVVTVR